MATNTLLQRLDDAASTAGSSDGASHRRQVEDFMVTLTNGGGLPAVVTLGKGTWVKFDNSKTGSDQLLYVAEADAVAAGNTLVVGVVLQDASTDTIAAGASQDVRVRVVTSGYMAEAKVTAGVTAGSRVVVDTTDGVADAAAAGEIPCGVVLTTIPVTNIGEVFVLKSF